MEALDHIKVSARTKEFERATSEFNQWRGRMIDNFARAEQAVSETLLALVGGGGAPQGTKLPHLTGQRFAALAQVMRSLDPAPSHVAPALRALELFGRNEDLRATLCHGAQKVALDPNGRWIVSIKLMIFKPQRVSRTSTAIDETDAASFLDQLEDDRRRLTTALGQVRSIVQKKVA